MTQTATDRASRSFTATSKDGINIRGTLYEGQGPERLVLIHSLAMERTFWNRLIPYLPAQCSIIAFDCRGHGASDKPAGPYTIETFGDDVAAVLDEAGWPSAVVAGASMGGCTTLAFATRYPERAQGLGLFDTTAWYGADAPTAWDKRAAAAETDGLASLVDFQVTRWFTDAFRAANPQVSQASVDIFLANDSRTYAATCRMLGHANLTAGLSRLAMPVRIAVGEEDYATPVAMSQTLQHHIKQATLRVVPQARHLSPIEVPDVIAAELKLLLDSIRDQKKA